MTRLEKISNAIENNNERFQRLTTRIEEGIITQKSLIEEMNSLMLESIKLQQALSQEINNN
jgi:hypothetical protein